MNEDNEGNNNDKENDHEPSVQEKEIGKGKEEG